jgi:phytanoyl-CoA hydroxylase
MFDLFKRLKFAYMAYNFFHKKDLYYNVKNFKRYGLNKKYYSPISSKDFSKAGNVQYSITVDEEKLKHTSIFSATNEENRKSLLSYNENGLPSSKDI